MPPNKPHPVHPPLHPGTAPPVTDATTAPLGGTAPPVTTAGAAHAHHSYYFGYYGDALTRVASADISSKIDALRTYMENAIMALQADVQALVDQVAANTSLEASAVAAFGVLQGQITDLQNQLANITPGAPVDPADLAAIQQAVTDLSNSATALQTAVPANTVPAPAPDQPPPSA